MALEVKGRQNNFGLLERAVRQRVRDYENEHPTPEEEDSRVSTFMRRTDYQVNYELPVGNPMSSNQFREFLRDTRFFVMLNNMEIRLLENENTRLTKRVLGSIERIQKDVDQLDSITTEEEIRINKNYDEVHYNAFTRERDMPLEADDTRWLVDFKTSLSFGPTQFLEVFPSAGATMPILDRLKVPIIDAVLVGEETDVGDTVVPIISTDPRYIFLPNKVFRHLIIRRENDDTSRIYNRNTSYCTLLLELAGMQTVNYLRCTPAAGSSVILHSLVYVNEANEEVELSVLRTNIDTGMILFFEPVRCRYLKVKFAQHAPVTKLGREHFDLETRELNKLLQGVAWTSRFSDSQEYIEGRVFDFSLKEISTGLQQYAATGIFRSKDQAVKNLASVAIHDAIDSISIDRQENLSGFTDRLPPGSVFAEYYVGVDIKERNGTRALQDLIPIPDSHPLQTEYLPLFGDTARLKLMPDLLWNLSVNRILTVTEFNNVIVEVTTQEPHGFEEDAAIGVIGPGAHPLAGTWTVRTVVDEYTFRIRVGSTTDSNFSATQNTTPRLYLYADTPDYNDVLNPPLKVYRDNTELALGTDYQINFGASQAWFSAFPRDTDLAQALEDPRSGKASVKIISPVFDSLYWAQYRPFPNQFLGKTKLVRLRNGRVVLSPKLRRARGTLNTIALIRQDYANPYLTPILRSYSLRMRNYK